MLQQFKEFSEEFESFIGSEYGLIVTGILLFFNSYFLNILNANPIIWTVVFTPPFLVFIVTYVSNKSGNNLFKKIPYEVYTFFSVIFVNSLLLLILGFFVYGLIPMTDYLTHVKNSHINLDFIAEGFVQISYLLILTSFIRFIIKNDKLFSIAITIIYLPILSLIYHYFFETLQQHVIQHFNIYLEGYIAGNLLVFYSVIYVQYLLSPVIFVFLLFYFLIIKWRQKSYISLWMALGILIINFGFVQKIIFDDFKNFWDDFLIPKSEELIYDYEFSADNYTCHGQLDQAKNEKIHIRKDDIVVLAEKTTIDETTSEYTFTVVCNN